VIFNVTGGTSLQRSYFNDAISLIKQRFPLDEYTDVVAVAYVADPEPTMQGELAFTTPSPLTTPPTDTIRIKSNLGLITPPAGGTRTWFIECIAHEIGHIIISKWNDTQKAAFCAIIGASYPADWLTGALSSSQWQRSAAEAAAEAFKDLYIPQASRVYDNRTQYSVPASKTTELDDLFRSGIPRPSTPPPQLTNDGGLLLRRWQTPVEDIFYWARAYQIRTITGPLYNVWGPYWNVNDPPGNIPGEPIFLDNPPGEDPASAVRATSYNISPTARMSLAYDLTSVWDTIVQGWRWEIQWWADMDGDGKGDTNQFDHYFVGPYPIIPGPTSRSDVDWRSVPQINYANSVSLQAVRRTFDCPIQGSIQLVPPDWATAVQLRATAFKPYFTGEDT
jgi:hypothetical protein